MRRSFSQGERTSRPSGQILQGPAIAVAAAPSGLMKPFPAVPGGSVSRPKRSRRNKPSPWPASQGRGLLMRTPTSKVNDFVHQTGRKRGSGQPGYAPELKPAEHLWSHGEAARTTTQFLHGQLQSVESARPPGAAPDAPSPDLGPCLLATSGAIFSVTIFWNIQ